MAHFHTFELTLPPTYLNIHTHKHTQTDGDYTKRVVTTLQDHTLKNSAPTPQWSLRIQGQNNIRQAADNKSDDHPLPSYAQKYQQSLREREECHHLLRVLQKRHLNFARLISTKSEVSHLQCVDTILLASDLKTKKSGPRHWKLFYFGETHQHTYPAIAYHDWRRFDFYVPKQRFCHNPTNISPEQPCSTSYFTFWFGTTMDPHAHALNTPSRKTTIKKEKSLLGSTLFGS